MRNHFDGDGGYDFLPELDAERDPDEGESITPLLDELLAEEQPQLESDLNQLLLAPLEPEYSGIPGELPDLHNVKDTGLDLTEITLPTSFWVNRNVN